MSVRGRVLIFTTCYNEKDNIGPLLDEIFASVPRADVLVIDDNSPDGTWTVIQQRRKLYPRLIAIQRPRKLGIGSAHKYALLYAMRENYDFLVTMDADFSHDPKSLPELLARAGDNIFVTGSRYCQGGKSDYSGVRNIVSRLGNFAARSLLNLRIKELTTYFRVFDVKSLRRLPLRHINSDGYSYGVQIVYYLHKAGVRLREVPIHFFDRRHGVSKIPKMQILTSALDLFKLSLHGLNPWRDLSPDAHVHDPCYACGDEVLAITDPPVCKCLRCGTEQIPNAVPQHAGSCGRHAAG